MPAEELRVARERVQRFELLGGVDLSRLADPDDSLRTEVEVGTAEHNRATFRFRCEICGRLEVSDRELEPLCDGPSWLTEHPPMVMVPVRPGE